MFICLSCVNAEDINDADIAVAGDDVISVTSDSDIVSTADVVKYYVNDSVTTSGNGSIDSPFKELNDAISKAESSQNVEIYIASGKYLVESRTDITLNHAGDGGSLSLIGYGGDVTFDMQSKYDFLSVGTNSKVNISNLIVTNGYSQMYWNYRGIVSSTGDLNIINCTFTNNAGYSSAVRGTAKIYSSLFKDNTARIDYQGIDFYGSGLIYNTTFYGNTRGQSIYADGNLVIDKSKFLDFNSQPCVFSWSPVELTNCIFNNCSKSMIPVSVNSDLVLSNNTFDGNGFLCAANSITCLGVIEVLNNKTIDFEGFGVDLSAKIYDDNGNLIRPESVDFYINETYAGTAYYEGNVDYTLNYQKVLNGTYIISAKSDGLNNFSVKTATLNAVPPKDKDVKYYVNNSVAVSGNGSIDSPFQSITEAIALANGFQNVEIYIASGKYEFNDYTFNVDINHEDGEGSLTFIGYGDSKPILDVGCSDYPIFSFSENTVIIMKNLSFTNPTVYREGGGVNYGGMIRVYRSSLSVEDCDFDGTYRGLPFIQSSEAKYIYCNNCRFENNTWGGESATGIPHCIEIDGAADSVSIINNCTFKDNINYNNITSFYGTWDQPVIYGKGYNVNYKLTVSNSTFINCPTIYRDMNDMVKVELTFDNDKFINTTEKSNQYMFQLYNPNTRITNSYFDLTPESMGYLLYMNNNIYLENNTISESSPVKWFNLALNKITSTHYVTILDNSSISIKSINIPLNATITDDMGNLIQTSARCQFYIDGKYVTQADFDKGFASATTKGAFEDGNYTVTSSIQSTDNRIVRTATLNIAQIKSIDVYVAETGDDESGNGSIDNPYKTMDKALDAALNNALSGNVYVKGGNYNITKFVEINGQNLTIVGYDGDVTFDMQNNVGFCYVGRISNVNISNVIFANGATQWGSHTYGILTVDGNLNVTNCTFINNNGYSSTIYDAGNSESKVIIDSCTFNDNKLDYNGHGKVINSTFYGNNHIAISANYGHTLIVDGSKFINFTRSCISTNNYLMQIKNSIFDNCTGITNNAPIYSSAYANVFLENNTFLNDGVFCYANYIASSGTVEVLENKTIDIESFGVDLSAKIYDDMGNLVKINSLNFYLNETNVGSATYNNDGVYTLKYKKLLNGTYIVSVKSDYLVNFTIKTATLNIIPLVDKDLYVSNSGSDENDGSEAHPFKTIEKAFNEALAYNNVIHIADGNYNISSPLVISTAGGTFTIIGSENTVIDLNKSSRFINSISSDSIVVLKDLDITNGYDEDGAGSIYNMGNLTINHVSFINSSCEIDWGVGGAIYNYGSLYVLNSKFINCSSCEGGAIYNERYLYLKNNTVESVFANDFGNYVLTTGTVDGVILTFNDNATQEITGSSVNLNVTVTDDNGNVITGSGVQISFTLNDINVATASLGDGIATTTVDIKLNGEYVLSGTLGNAENNVVKTATLKFNNPDVLNDVWVSTDGSDDENNGSRDHPFATIQHALTVVSAVNPTIHILSGNYTYAQGIAISNIMNLTIKGEDDDVVLIMDKETPIQSYLFTISGANTVVNLVNLNITGGLYQNYGPVNLNGGTLNIYDCNFYDLVRGIQSSGTVNVYNSYFNQNNMPNIDSSSTLYIVNSTFVGRLQTTGGTLYMVNSTLKDSTWTAINLRQTTATFINSTFSNIANTIFYTNNNVRLTIDGCNFTGNHYASNGGIIYGNYVPRSLVITNNVFDSNNYSVGTLYLQGSATVINNTFKNNVANRGAVVNIISGNVEFVNNTAINNTALIDGNYIYISSDSAKIYGSKYILTFNENQTIDIEGNVLHINATLMDADGNLISGSTVYITLNGSDFKNMRLVNGTIDSDFKFAGEGTYVLSGYINNILNPEDLTILSSTINVKQIKEKIIYVDVLGDDELGDGSEDNPYLTLSRAFKDINAINTTIYMKPGEYTGDLNCNLVLDVADNSILSIIGLPDETGIVEFVNITKSIISNSVNVNNFTMNIKNIDIHDIKGETTSVTLFTFMYIENLNFENVNIYNISNVYHFSYFTQSNVVLNNVSVFDSTVGNSFMDQYKSLTINNSSFKNIVTYSLTGSSPYSSGKLIINNSEFENIVNNWYMGAQNLYINNSSFKNFTRELFYTNTEALVENSIFENNVGTGNMFTLNAGTLNIFNSVFANNSCLYVVYTSNDYAKMVLNNNWWGRNITSADIPVLIYGANTFDNWVVADVTPSELVINENNTITVKFISNDGSELNATLPARIVGAIAESAIFENGQNSTSYIINGNEVSFTVLPDAFGTVNLTIDNQEFTLNIVKANTTVSAEDVEITYGDDLVINVTLSVKEAGNVIFLTVNNETYNATTDTSGVASFEIKDVLDVDNYTVEFKFNGTEFYNPSNGTSNLTIKKIVPVIFITADNITVSDDLLIKVEVDGTGNVTVKVGEFTETKDLNNTVVIFNADKFAADNYTIEVTYGGDATHETASETKDISVTKLESEIKVEVENATVGTITNVTVTVPNATGKVSIKVANKTDTKELNNSVAKFEIKDLAAEDYTVEVSYGGDDNYNPNTAEENFTISKVSEYAIDAKADDIKVGEDLIIEVTVPDDASGNVTVKIGNDTYSEAIKEGVAKFTIKDLAYDNYTAEISYAGDDKYDENAASVDFKVEKVTDYAIDATASEAKKGENVTITVSVPADATGNVTVKVEEGIYTEAIKDGKAVFTIPDLNAGNHTAEITYDGDGKYATSQAAKDFSVAKADNYTFDIEAPVADVGKDAVITVTLPDDATGNVTVEINNETYTEAVKEGKAVFAIPGLVYGDYPFTVRYPGDDNYEANSTEGTLSVLTRLPSEIEINIEEGCVGDLTNITVTVANATGKVSIKIGEYTDDKELEDSSATFAVDGLAYGNYTVEVTYAGDLYYEPSTGSENFTVSKVSDYDVSAEASEAKKGENVTVTVSVPADATGNVTIKVEDGIYTEAIKDGKAVFTVPGLEAGDYTAEISYAGDAKYAESETTLDFTVDKADVELNITTEDGVDVELPEDATGYVLVDVNGTGFYAPVKDGKADVKIIGLEPGTYNATVTYTGDDNYNEITTTGEVTVPEVIPEEANVTVAVNDSDVSVELPEDAEGYVVVSVNGTDYFFNAGDDIELDLSGLAPGEYPVEIAYSGDDKYAPATANTTVTVPEVVPEEANVTVAVNDSDVSVELPEDAEGYVVVSVNGTDYFFNAGDDIELDLSGLAPGEYPVEIAYSGDDKYAPATANTTVTVPEVVPEEANVTVAVNDSDVSVELPEDAEGYVVVSVGDKKYYFDADDEIELDLSDLAPGEYPVEITYSGDDKYAPATANTTVTVPEVVPEDANLTATAQNTTITVKLAENATGNVLVDVNGTGYYASIENGQATVEVIGLDEGEYQAIVTYSGDEIYAPANVTVAVTVPPAPKNDTPVDSEANVSVSDDEISIDLPEDATGYMLVDVDGTGYYVPVENGTAAFELPELAPGNHTVSVTYTGDKKYAPANATETIEVPAPEETILSEDLTKVEKAPERFVATFLDENGNPLVNASVTFDVNGAVYTRTTNANGSASIAITLIAGNYTITLTNPATGEVKTNNITVLSRFVEDYDLVKYFRNDTQYVLKVLDDEGNPAKAGEIISYNINGVFYNRTTNETGHVKLNINLQPGDYIITAEYKGCKVAHNVTVLPVLTASNFTKKFGEAGAFEAKLVDGQGNPYAGQSIGFNINGVFYNRTTDSNGIARLNINLLPGEYIITSSYGYALAANKVTVTA
ncbi:Ig-like domain repeat protein [Methanobrevibacter sp.]|uniref:Ig-like domain repeat protein n=1 Tax=Methanobrevibacter sp. TaxID=66852 RepID=UPI00388F4DE8